MFPCLTTRLVSHACPGCPNVQSVRKTIARLHTRSGKTDKMARPPLLNWHGHGGVWVPVVGMGTVWVPVVGTVRVQWVQYWYGTGTVGTVPASLTALASLTVLTVLASLTVPTVLYPLYCTHHYTVPTTTVLYPPLYCTHPHCTRTPPSLYPYPYPSPAQPTLSLASSPWFMD